MDKAIVVRERDANGLPSATYEGFTARDVADQSGHGRSQGNGSGTVLSAPDVAKNLVRIFLPTGFPNSVSGDYVGYQIFDSVQAFSSSIASLFANRCVLSAVGVGDQNATSTSALFVKIIQEMVGRTGTIFFAWRLGSALEPECKKYRYLADLVNDSATIFDCLSPHFAASRSTKVTLLCISGLLRSICGVFAGGSRAALTQHFTDPKRGSIADVNAKDQAQETVITLMGMMAGSAVVSMVPGEGLAMWVAVLMLLTVHLWTNYKAVRSVVMRSLNRQRCNIVFSDLFETLKVVPEKGGLSAAAQLESLDIHMIMSPAKVSRIEAILEPDGFLRWYRGGTVLQTFGTARFSTFGAVVANLDPSTELSALFDVCNTAHTGYVLSYRLVANAIDVRIALLDTSQSALLEEIDGLQYADLRAWVHALVLSQQLSIAQTQPQALVAIAESRALVDSLFDQQNVADALTLAGWTHRPSVQSGPNPTFVL